MSLDAIRRGLQSHTGWTNRWISAGLKAAALVTLVAGCQQRAAEQAEETAQPATTETSVDPVERGKYLVTVVGCNDCHTPLKMGATGPEPDMSRMLSGHPSDLVLPPPPKLPADSPWGFVGTHTLTAFAGPWGISYAINLTPDENTGIGIWTEDMFVKAMKTGKHMGQSRTIMPPMPWPWYSKMTDEDLKAIYAYLRTVPPIVNQVPDYAPPPEAP
jgi:mono/diheme cytochrome c family protein